MASAGIALAQEEPAITPAQEDPAITGVAGILEKPGYAPEGYSPYAITDEATGVRYIVHGVGCTSDSHVGKRTIVYGPVLEGYYPPALIELEIYEDVTGLHQPDHDFFTGLALTPGYRAC